MRSYLLGYQCADCEPGTFNTDMTKDPVCPLHGRVQEARYDIAAIKREIDRDRIPAEPQSLWRWSFLLPVREPGNIVSLQEGETPLFHATRLGDRLGLPRLYIKDESRNPTGSFKDRGASVTVSKSKEVGVAGLILASSGNAAAAFSAYSARAGLAFFGFLRDDTTDINRLHTQVPGTRIHIVEGGMVEGAALAGEVARKYGLFHCAQPYNLYRIEGKKTLAFEISRQLGWRVPDRIMIPTSGGTNAVAIYKGYRELNALGWVKRIPAIDIVQATGCHPIVKAWRTGRAVENWGPPATKVMGFGHAFPKAGDAIVRIMKETGGVGWLASDDESIAGTRMIAETEGLFLQPSSASPVACLQALGREKAKNLYGDQLIVAIGTGSGKNQVVEPLAAVGRPPRIAATLAAFDAVNGDLRPAARRIA
ncbi:MAG: threonine synthase [Rhodospirillales bacterium]|nr:threonine synthase [Rhodospirillales bacterium]